MFGHNNNFSDEDKKLFVWCKGTPIQGFDPSHYRLDSYGKIMQWDKHGDRNHSYGWEMDHIVPKSFGSVDHVNNLRPLNWLNNVQRKNNLFS